MDEISLPLDLMRALSHQITIDSQNVLDEVSACWKSIQYALPSALPRVMQEQLNAQLETFQQQLDHLLNTRMQLGERLAAAADEAQNVDNMIAQSF